MNRRANGNWVVVFDLDDTLYPEADFVRGGIQAVDQVLQSHGVQGFAAQANMLFQEGLRGKIFDAALVHLGAPATPELITELVEIYRSHSPQLTLFADACRALDDFDQKSKIALLTDGYAAVQRNKVRALGLANRFAACIYTDDLGRAGWKPSSVPFLKIAAMLGMTDAMDSLVYVADNPMKDFVAPNQLGWTTVRVRRPGGEYAALEPQEDSHAAKHEIVSLEELAGVLSGGARRAGDDQMHFIAR
jgi:putative hydrolase of the HAD superfamily